MNMQTARYVDFCLEGVEDGSAIRDLELLEKKIFSFYGMQTYYYSVNYVQSFGGNLKNVRSMHYKIVNAEDRQKYSNTAFMTDRKPETGKSDQK